MTLEDTGLELMPTWTGDKFQELVPFPVIVEQWDKVSECGRQRRAFHAEFTVKERRKIQDYHVKFAKWYLRTGTPQKVQCRLSTIQLLHRACDFFASM